MYWIYREEKIGDLKSVPCIQQTVSLLYFGMFTIRDFTVLSNTLGKLGHFMTKQNRYLFCHSVKA